MSNHLYPAYTEIKPTPQQYRASLVLKYTMVLAGLYHAFFVAVFAFLGVMDMAVFNIFSVAAYGAAYALNGRSRRTLAYTVVAVEIIVHAILATIYVGWNAGFLLYLLCVVPFTFFSLDKSFWLKVWISVVMALIYTATYLYSCSAAPFFAIAGRTISMLYCMNVLSAFFSFFVLSYFYDRATSKAERDLVMANEKLDKLAGTDPLTGLLNRRSMMREIHSLIERYQVEKKLFAIVIVDIDNFKQFNDSYGHDCGDFILNEMTRLMKEKTGLQDHIARWGGEEFLILLSEVDLLQCRSWCETLRKAVLEAVFHYQEEKLRATITVGCSMFDGSKPVEKVIMQADHALYAGKQQGKNCVIVE